MQNFSDTLNYLIEQNEITKNQLAKKINIGSSHISGYCNDTKLPSVETLIVLADYFNCSTDYLLGLSETNNNAHIKPNIKFNLQQFYNRFELSLKGKSIYEFQKQVNLPISVLYYWKRLQRNPSVGSLIKLGEILPVSIDYLLGRKD